MVYNKELNVFTVGNYDNSATFSGVPFYFIKALENKGYNVHKVNIINSFISGIYDKIITRILNKIFKDSTYSYYRSRLCYFLSNRKIKKTCKRYSNSNYNIFTTFSFSSLKVSDIPVILFSDDTYEKLIFETKERNPYYIEKYALKKERYNLENANIVISLFPELKEYIIKNYKRNKGTYFIGNALNFETIPALEPKKIIKQKLSNRNLLFIGRKYYLQGAELLIKAFIIFNNNTKEKFQLHIIGLNESDVNFKDDFISYYGYLKKDVPEEFKKYIELIEKSRFFLNPTYGGGTYLTTLEVMYFYTPLIIYPHVELEKIFGEKLNEVGIILEKESEESLAKKIRDAINDTDNWEKMALNAHNIVKDYSWNNFINSLEEKLTMDKINK